MLLSIFKRDTFIYLPLNQAHPLLQHICIYRFFFLKLRLTDTSVQSLTSLLRLPGGDDICSAREQTLSSWVAHHTDTPRPGWLAVRGLQLFSCHDVSFLGKKNTSWNINSLLRTGEYREENLKFWKNWVVWTWRRCEDETEKGIIRRFFSPICV